MTVPFVADLIAATAETNRARFHLPEAEYANICVVAAVAVTLFWGVDPLQRNVLIGAFLILIAAGVIFAIPICMGSIVVNALLDMTPWVAQGAPGAASQRFVRPGFPLPSSRLMISQHRTSSGRSFSWSSAFRRTAATSSGEKSFPSVIRATTRKAAI